MKAVLACECFTLSFSQEILQELKNRGFSYLKISKERDVEFLHFYPLNKIDSMELRSDPILVNLIEELKPEGLRVVEFPDDADVYIGNDGEHYEGYEAIIEKHNVWG